MRSRLLMISCDSLASSTFRSLTDHTVAVGIGVGVPVVVNAVTAPAGRRLEVSSHRIPILAAVGGHVHAWAGAELPGTDHTVAVGITDRWAAAIHG
jgi:hypothetical protein